MTGVEALQLAIEIAERNCYMGEHNDPGGNFGGTQCCEYECSKVIAGVLKQELLRELLRGSGVYHPDGSN